MSVAEVLSLRPRQQHAIHLAHEQWRAGRRVLLFVLPTGAGKRYVAVWWAAKAQQQGKEVLIVTDRRILVKQMHDELHRFGVDYGVLMNEYEENRQPTVQVASIQTLESRYLATGEGLPPADLILIDECHKALDAYANLLKFYPNAKVLGLTATPVGPQGRALVPGCYEVMVEGCRNSELIADGLLLPTLVYAPSEPHIKGVKINSGGEYAQRSLGTAVRGVTTFANIFDEWAPFADRKTILFAPSVAYCRGLAYGTGEHDSFKARGIRAEVIDHTTKTKDRDRIFDEFQHGDLKVLVSVDVLKEGFDAPIASCGIDLQPNAQLRTFWQKVGRVKRAYPGQTDAVWIDMAGNCWRFLHPDDDPDWHEVTGEVTTQDLMLKKRTPARCSKCDAVRTGAGKCPGCGAESKPEESVRMVRMGNGKLKKIPAHEVKKREKSAQEKLADKWKSELFAGLTSGKTFKQCAVAYRRRNGKWPPKNLPAMPKYGAIEWGMKVVDVYTARDIMQQFHGGR